MQASGASPIVKINASANDVSLARMGEVSNYRIAIDVKL